MLPALLSVTLYTGAFFATVQFLGSWLDRTGQLDKSAQGPMWIVLGLVSALGSALLGRVADRLGKRRYVLWATGLVAIGLAALSTVETLWLVTALGVPVGVLSASRGAALLALVSDLVPAESRGTLMGLRSAAVNLGTGTMPVVAGYAIEARGFPTFLVIASLAVALAWLLVWRGVAERTA